MAYHEYDDHTPVASGGCPDCGSPNFAASIAVESCPDCGYYVNYRSGESHTKDSEE